MGTHGFRVYRHRGYYHSHYNPYDSYPAGLGVEVAAEIPLGDAKAYQEWLENLRTALDHHLEMNRERIGSEEGNYLITDSPVEGHDVSFVYEIDLDHEVFLGKCIVDDEPLFALNCMPDTPELFIECIGFDSYGRRSYASRTPEKHIYNWKSVPPHVNDELVHEYANYMGPNPAYSSISELLGHDATGHIGDCEAARIALYEGIIGTIISLSIGRDICILETVPDREHISDEMLSLGVHLVQVTCGRILFSDLKRNEHPHQEKSQFSWLASDICLHVTTHLDDERNMKKSTLQLVDEVILNRQPGYMTYGILFSFFHCVVVQVDPHDGFKSTAVLQFLPSFHTESPSTPGITAIGRLAYHCLCAPRRNNGVAKIQPNHYLHQVPLEILDLIATLLGPSDLDRLCAAAPPFQLVAEDKLRYPHIDDYCLVQSLPLLDEDWEVDRDDEQWGPSVPPLPFVRKKRFSAVLPGSFKKKLLIVSQGGSTAFSIPAGRWMIGVKWKVKKFKSRQKVESN
ncbi:hypothetical protein B0H16DRAFT_1889631 [Mycena metata]|uniref:F-box domain-containing protein n=1 Tax=Mycena metata TaxID=1033252 RepID=A0AAD7IK46_9AGAR|nr:hypothetical protein B0H16DRAFT_1889631 [Mycena metata]